MTQVMTIKLDTIDKVKSFVAQASTYHGDLLVQCGQYVVNGKSIMGLLSLDLSKELTLKTDSNTSLVFAADFEIKEEPFA